jgi:hypothetical protein
MFRALRLVSSLTLTCRLREDRLDFTGGPIPCDRVLYSHCDSRDSYGL